MNQKFADEQAESTASSEICLWGSDSEGQLGLGTYSYDLFYGVPRFIKYQINIIRVSCGFEHTLILSEMGNCYAMGSNKFGQVGLGSNVTNQSAPTMVPCFGKKITVWNVAAGGHHS
jgi:alpha-tubulin suppressor-like RCC1 family protein